jgi:hypothetical protein
VGRDGTSRKCDLPDGESEIFLQTGLDKHIHHPPADLPVGQIRTRQRRSAITAIGAAACPLEDPTATLAVHCGKKALMPGSTLPKYCFEPGEAYSTVPVDCWCEPPIRAGVFFTEWQ